MSERKLPLNSNVLSHFFSRFEMEFGITPDQVGEMCKIGRDRMQTLLSHNHDGITEREIGRFRHLYFIFNREKLIAESSDDEEAIDGDEFDSVCDLETLEQRFDTLNKALPGSVGGLQCKYISGEVPGLAGSKFAKLYAVLRKWEFDFYEDKVSSDMQYLYQRDFPDSKSEDLFEALAEVESVVHGYYAKIKELQKRIWVLPSFSKQARLELAKMANVSPTRLTNLIANRLYARSPFTEEEIKAIDDALRKYEDEGGGAK